MPDKLKALRAEIDTRLGVYLDKLPNTIGVAVSPNGERALQLLQEFALRPGKRLRGALAIVAYEMFGGTKHQTALDLALAVELAQDYLLIVDDVMDRSDTRRGRPTVHLQYRDILKSDNVSANDRDHIGDMLGISVGLIAQHLSARILSELKDDARRVIRAQQLFQTNIAVTAFGQMDDLTNQAYEHFTLTDTRRMYMLKSGYYTFVNPLQLGAVLAGVEDKQLEVLQEFGEYAGLAFQLQDDLLGMFGNEEATGKSSMDDLHEGKMTLLIRHALVHADARRLQEIHAIYGNRSATRQEHAQICAILIETGSRDYVIQEAQKAVRVALGTLSAQVTWDARGRRCLSDLLNYTINRGE